MSFILKRSRKKGYKTYLQIVETHYSPEKKYSVQRLYKKLGDEQALSESLGTDAYEYYKKEVDTLNKKNANERKALKETLISETSPLKNIGYFLPHAVYQKMSMDLYLDILLSQSDIQCDKKQLLHDLVMARIVCPSSKKRAYEQVIPSLFEHGDHTLSQVYELTRFIGENYQKFIEIFNKGILNVTGRRETGHVYFDCTNYYFEIDVSDSFRRPGPSKEERHNPIVGQALLLDADCIPLGMHLYPGNQSEKPEIRKIISEMKNQDQITGRTIQVADKGLNCARNIFEAVSNGDGYIYSQSVMGAGEVEKEWVKLDSAECPYVEVKDKNGEVLYKIKSRKETISYKFTDESGKKTEFSVEQMRIATFSPSLARKKKMEILKQAEKANKLCLSAAKRSEYGDSSKYVTFVSESDVKAVVNQDAIDEAMKLAGYNEIITSEIKEKPTAIYSTYHHLWIIENTFRIMKSQLDARPVYVQHEDSIKGHFTICYLAVIILRLLQFRCFEEKISAEQLTDYIRDFQVTDTGKSEYINTMRDTPVVKQVEEVINMGTRSLIMTEKKIQKLMKYKFVTRK